MNAHKPSETQALPIGKFAKLYAVHPSTIWRAIRDGRLEYVVVGRRKLVLLPPVKRNAQA
jgi:hypothetical protein